MKSLPRSAVVIFLVLLTGCTTHYRESLATYRTAEPLPFYQRTMDWAGKAPEAEPADVRAVEEAVTEEVPAPADRFVQIASKVLGKPTEWFEAESTRYEDPTAREHALENRLDWDELIVAVALLNPAVHAAREEWLATSHQYSQAEFLEDLLREYRTFTRYLDVSPGEPLNKEMAKSYFPYPSTISLKGEMIREEMRLAELDWEQTLRDALVAAGELFFDYQFQYQGAATVEENVQLLDDLVNVVQDRYATGLASQVDVLRLQTELERQRNLLRDFESRQRSDAAGINAILGRPADAPLGRPGEEDLPYHVPSQDALMEIAKANRQEILAQQARVGRTEIAIRMGEVMNRPLFTQGYSTLERGMMPEASVAESASPFGATPGAQRPIPAYAQAEAYLAEVRQRLAGERANLEQVLADTGAMARTLLEQADIAHRQLVLVHEVVLPLDQSAYDVAQRTYTAGDVSFIDLLDTERALIQTRLERDESRRMQNEALVRLATVQGFLANP